jgi:hypothetical protein
MVNKNYHSLSTFRLDKTGGGALLLISKSYAASCSPIEPVMPPPPPWLVTSKKRKKTKKNNPSNNNNEKEEPLWVDIKMAKFKVNKLPRGYSSVLAVCVYIAEFGNGDTDRQRTAIWRIIHAVENASKCSSIGVCPLIIIAGDFNRPNTEPLRHALKLHQINNLPTHKSGSVLDIVLTHAPKCYDHGTWCALADNDNKVSDHLVVHCFPTQIKYNNQLPPPVKRLVRSGRVGPTVNILRDTNWAPITSQARFDPQLTIDQFYEIVKAAED